MLPQLVGSTVERWIDDQLNRAGNNFLDFETGPVLPGFLIGIAFHPHDAAMFVGMGVATSAMLISGTLVGPRSRVALCIVASIASFVSIASSFFAYLAFRA